MNALSPLVSEFETVEQADAYLDWLKAMVAASRADERPSVAHQQATERVRAIIKAKGR